jgi:glyoxalase family protein
MQLTGIHHVTAVTAHAAKNHAFYTETLGLRLVKKTVNQDDVSAYHLFYADGIGSPGSDLTFFDWPLSGERRGARSVTRTGLRVGSETSLEWWLARLTSAGVTVGKFAESAGRVGLDFEDFEGQRLQLVVDGGSGDVHPWSGSPVPVEHQIRGLGPVELSVADAEATARVLTEVMNLRLLGTERVRGKGTELRVFAMGAGGAGAELHVRGERDAPESRLGAGGVHHVAFRTRQAEYEKWAERLEAYGLDSSGPVDRYYFKSLYFREPSGVLFEIATDEPGFAADEPLDSLGMRLSLPPFLEPRRAAIEAGLKPLAL